MAFNAIVPKAFKSLFRTQEVDESLVRRSEVSQEAINLEFSRRARMSGVGQIANQSRVLDVQRIQNALRSAEYGEVYLLYAIFRDMLAGYSHLQCEWGKRRAVIVGNTESVIPFSEDQADIVGAEVIQQMIEGCDNWFSALDDFMDATLYPLSASEKIYEPVSLSDAGRYKHPLRFRLKAISRIPFELHCFRVPYQTSYSSEGSLSYNVDDWESWLRFYSTLSNGAIDYTLGNTYRPNRDHHIVHHGNLVGNSIPPNFGGQMRAILFWWLLATQDRDWWAQFLEKYGAPFLKGAVDSQQKDTISNLQQAFALANRLGGIVYDKRAVVELEQANQTDGSQSHKVFNDYCNCEVSKIVIGQVLSSTPKNTGLGSGMADQAEEVREDIRMRDSLRLQDTLRTQLFRQFLDVNGYSKSRTPFIYWGGMRPNAAAMFASTLKDLGAGQYELDDEGITTASRKFGFAIRRREMPEPVMQNGPRNGSGNGQ